MSNESSLTGGRLTDVSFEPADVSLFQGNSPASTSSSGHGYNDPSSFSHQFNQGNGPVSVEVVLLFTTVMFVAEFDANPSLEGDMVGLTYTDVTDTLNGSFVDTFTGASDDDNVSCDASKVGSRLADDDNVSSETDMVGSFVVSIGSLLGLSVTTTSTNGVGIMVGSSLIIPDGLGGLIIVITGNVGSSVGVSVGSGSLIVGSKVGKGVIMVVVGEDGRLVGRGVLVGCFVVGLDVGANDGCPDGIIDG